MLQSCFLSEKRIGPVCSDYDGRIEVPILASAAHPNDLIMFVDQVIYDGRGDKQCSSFFCLACKPAIKLGTQDGEAVVGWLSKTLGAKVNGKCCFLCEK